jgi:hypothetical protein
MMEAEKTEMFEEFRSPHHAFVVYMSESSVSAYLQNSFIFERFISNDIQWNSLDHHYPLMLLSFIEECYNFFNEKKHTEHLSRNDL